MKALLFSKEFRYRNSEETRKPGYLAKRFAKIRREQAERDKTRAEVVQMKRQRK